MKLSHDLKVGGCLNNRVTSTTTLRHSIEKVVNTKWGHIGGQISNQTDLIDYIEEVLASYPTYTDLTSALNNKVDKISGYGLSQNDFSNVIKAVYDDAVVKSHIHTNKAILDGISQEDINKWNNPSTKPTDGWKKSDLDSSVQESLDKADSALQEHQDISGKVDKVEGKGLSTNDFTDEDKTKVANAITSSYHDSTKQDKITDLSTIRDNALNGNTAYQEIHKTDGIDDRLSAVEEFINDLVNVEEVAE